VSCDAAFAEIELARCLIICICASAEIAHRTGNNTKLNSVPIAGTTCRLLRMRSKTSRAITLRPPNIQDKNGLTLSATNHAIHLPVKYLPNASARRNCHTLPLRFDSYYESFVDHKLYQFSDVVIVFADRVLVLRYRF
jgi:hypothetical protein